MTDPRLAEPLRPSNVYRADDPSMSYWIHDGSVRFLHEPVPGADPATFVFFAGGFAKDARHCYCGNSRLRGADPATFRALNFTYFRDAGHVWTLGGALQDVDLDTFAVCDDGVLTLIAGTRAPYGYARDKRRVYYYDFDGKPNPVRKADPVTFTSLNDGYFATDDHFVFCAGSVIPGARVFSWQKIGGLYSSDGARVYYLNRSIPGADAATFECVHGSPMLQLARDKSGFYMTDTPVDEAEAMELLAEVQVPC